MFLSALSGIDQALWDIKGKFYGAPVWQLMRRRLRDKMRVYSLGWRRPSARCCSRCKRKTRCQFTAIKMNTTDELQMIDSYKKIDEVLEGLQQFEKTCGKYFGITIDFSHGQVHKPMAKILAKNWKSPCLSKKPVLCENMEDFNQKNCQYSNRNRGRDCFQNMISNDSWNAEGGASSTGFVMQEVLRR